MSTVQIFAMEPSIARVHEGISGPDDAPKMACTFEATSVDDRNVWIQAMPGTVNMQYPHTDDPEQYFPAKGVRAPEDLYFVEWKAGEYATFGFDSLDARDFASFVDQLFVKVLSCDDDTYEPRASFESLEE
jgi:hypothetical protein